MPETSILRLQHSAKQSKDQMRGNRSIETVTVHRREMMTNDKMKTIILRVNIHIRKKIHVQPHGNKWGKNSLKVQTPRDHYKIIKT